ITSWYQSPNRRYNNYFVVLKNNLRAQENGGLISTALLDSPRYQENRFLLPTRLGYDQTPEPREFGRNLSLGNEYKETVGFMRQQYDFGQKDSLVTDTIVIPLFYPRLRLEHDFRYSSQDYRFVDFTGQDSAYFKSIYNQEAAGDSFQFRDVWRELTNDFSIYQFPDAKNLQQYIKLGATLQLLKGRLRGGDQGFYNFIGHGEYRNRTRNGKWDIQAFGRLHFTGLNAGDYHAYVSLLRISEQLGSLQLGFQNTNRSPSMIYDERSHFYLDAPNSFGKENTIHFFAQTELRRQRLQLRGDYFITTNYLYLTKNYLLQQESSLFNVLRVSARKSFRIGRHWNWHTEAYLQQKAGNAEVHFPLLLTRNRFAFEGNFFKNLHLSTGLEVRYHSPFKADDYSPVLGQFFYQDSVTISNRPDIHAYLHFRIRTFRGYVRVENLNTLSFANGIGFHKNNLAAPNYPYPPRMIRFGVYWVFVN
ncbi:MAG TPA: putative porin, partial [Chitinophagaceae bacterium]|nr:putative porin [Chitinophagaceae bacterium]